MNTPFDPSIYLNRSSRTLACHDCSGDDREELTFTPELLYFDFIQQGLTSTPHIFTITNSGTIPVGIETVEVTGDFQLVEPAPVNLPHNLGVGESIELSITFSPTGDGARVGDVIIKAGTAEAQECVHLIGIGGADAFAGSMAALQAQLDAMALVNQTQTQQIEALQQLLEGYVAEVTLYTWHAYANSPDGLDDFSTTDSVDKTFVGFAYNKTTPVPSEDPGDYRWLNVRQAVGDLVAFDTLNVAGRPSSLIIGDMDTLALQLLAYQFDAQQLRDYVDQYLYVEGVPVNTAIVNLSSEVIAGENALAETLGLIGAKNSSGDAFILDLNKTFVGPDESLGVRLSVIQANHEANQASVYNLTQAIADANYASASDLSLLGAKTADGTAWQMNLATIQVSPTQTLSQYINTVVAAAAGGAASVTEIYEATITPAGDAVAKAMLQLDVNGHVVGYAATNSEDYGQIVFSFDSFVIQDPSGNPLLVAEDGVVKMHNVEIDTLKVNSVETDDLVANAVTKKLYWNASYGAGVNSTAFGAASTGVWYEFGNAGDKATLTTPVLPASCEVAVRVYINMQRTGSDNDRVWFRLKRTPYGGGAATYVGNSIKSGMGNYPTVMTFEWTDTPAAGAWVYTVEFYREDGIGQYHSAKMILDLGKG